MPINQNTQSTQAKIRVYTPFQLLLVGLFGLFVSGVMLMALAALLLTPTLPSIDHLAENHFKVPMRVYTQDDVLIAEFGEEKRIPVKINEVPDLLIKAVLAAEDESFYFHQGVDFTGIIRATWNNLRSGRTAEGASTITMQVARNYFLSPEKTFTRKFKEILLAFKIERELSKDQILELYLNKIFLGSRAYGFAAAAQLYYGKQLKELTLPEIAMLAGLPKAPSRDNPLTNPENAAARRNYVLNRMRKLKFIDETAFAEAQLTPILASRHPLKFNVDAPYIAEMVRQYMVQAYSEKTYADGFNVYTTINAKDQLAADKALHKGLLAYERRHGYRGPAGHENINSEADRGRLDDILKDYQAVGELLPAVVLKVEDKSAQVYSQNGNTLVIDWPGLAWAQAYIDENTLGPAPKKAADILHAGDVVYIENIKEDAWALAQAPLVAGALVSLRPSDGAILALSGGFDFYESSFNRIIQAERQPGSSFKPFVYSAALEKGFTAASLISGAPIVVEDANLEDEWRPEDYSRKFFGPTRLRKALTLSLNLVSVRLLRAIGPDFTIEYLTRFGFDPKQLPRNLSLALGTASVTPLQMTSAFAVFANGGYKVTPYFIARVEDGNHNVLEQARPAIVCPQCPAVEAIHAANTNPEEKAASQPAPRVIDPENVFIMTSMMKDVVTSGTGQLAMELGRKDIAGKTGTTNEHRDAWFSGFNADVVTTAWVGFDQPAPLGAGEVGGRAALPIWIDYMRSALQGIAEKPLIPPAGIVTATINRETGKLTESNDPEAMQEYFVEGTLPGQVNAKDGTVTQEPPQPENIREGLF